MEETDPALVSFELDLYWITYAGKDPLDYLVGNEERFPLFHVKDGITTGPLFEGFRDLGEGVVDFQRVFSALRNKNAHHYLLERDTQPHPEQTVRDGYAYMDGLRAARRGARR
jgi:sugar phosphate isomerase/epimerase